MTTLLFKLMCSYTTFTVLLYAFGPNDGKPLPRVYEPYIPLVRDFKNHDYRYLKQGSESTAYPVNNSLNSPNDFNESSIHTIAETKGLETTIAETKGLETISTTPRQCNCSDIYDPVCGNDYKSYYNYCTLKCESTQLVVLYLGNCIPFK